MNVYRYVTPLIVILLLTVLFVGVVTIHQTIDTTASFPLEGASMKYKGVTYVSYAPNGYAFCHFQVVAQRFKEHGSQLRRRDRFLETRHSHIKHRSS